MTHELYVFLHLPRHLAYRRLKEEALEKRVKKELPRVLKRLHSQLPAWQAQHKRVLVFTDQDGEGQPCLEVIDGVEDAHTTKRSTKRAATRAMTATAATRTPSRASSTASAVSRDPKAKMSCFSAIITL